MSAKKRTAEDRAETVKILRALLGDRRKAHVALVRRVERMVADLACRSCGHAASSHYWAINSDLCDRCLRDNGPAEGYRSRSNRHRLLLKVRER